MAMTITCDFFLVPFISVVQNVAVTRVFLTKHDVDWSLVHGLTDAMYIIDCIFVLNLLALIAQVRSKYALLTDFALERC
jgi:hypothetical protein